MSVKTKTLHVDVRARVSIDYNDEELAALGKTFREFKAGIENLVADQLLPDFQADKHTKVEVMTVGFPSRRKLAKGLSKRQKRIAQIMNPANFVKDKNDE